MALDALFHPGSAEWARFRPVTLREVESTALLQRRMDRKYLASSELLRAVLDELSDTTRVLEINGQRAFAYATVYFDTPGLTMFYQAARGRPGRYKTRTRAYGGSGLCVIEAKLSARSGETVKVRERYDPAHRWELTEDGRRFLAGVPAVAPHVESLSAVAETSFQRGTLVVGRTRATIDLNVAVADQSGRVARFGAAIIETKTAGHPGPIDRLLWRLGARPVVVSKYGAGLAALRPDLPRNRWHRLIERSVAVSSSPAAPAPLAPLS